MTDNEVAQTENAVPELAVKALTAAHCRARASGRPVVLLMNGNLVRIGPLGSTVLKSLPPRVKVSERTKRTKA